MSRRKAASKRTILADPLFENELIAKFVNIVMRKGKKSIAEKIVYGALNRAVTSGRSKIKNILEGETADKEESVEGEGSKSGGVTSGGIKTSGAARQLALKIFIKALDTVRPSVEVKSRRVGGATYQVPIEVDDERGKALAMRWVVESAKKRGEKGMELRLAGEIMDAVEGKGGSIKKREDVHKMAKANQAFAHYRW